MDHQTPYLKTTLAFVGLSDVTFIYAEGVAGGEDGIRAAEQAVSQLVSAMSAKQAA